MVVAPIQLASEHHHQANRGVEMRARDRREDGDDHDQHGAGREGVAEERQRVVPAREPRGHDARANHGRDQQRGAQRFRRQAASQDRNSAWPPLT